MRYSVGDILYSGHVYQDVDMGILFLSMFYIIESTLYETWLFSIKILTKQLIAHPKGRAISIFMISNSDPPYLFVIIKNSWYNIITFLSECNETRRDSIPKPDCCHVVHSDVTSSTQDCHNILQCHKWQSQYRENSRLSVYMWGHTFKPIPFGSWLLPFYATLVGTSWTISIHSMTNIPCVQHVAMNV